MSLSLEPSTPLLGQYLSATYSLCQCQQALHISASALVATYHTRALSVGVVLCRITFSIKCPTCLNSSFNVLDLSSRFGMFDTVHLLRVAKLCATGASIFSNALLWLGLPL